MKPVRFAAGKDIPPTRLDKLLRQQFPHWGRRAIGRIINQRQVQVNGKQVWLGSWKVQPGDQITVLQPPEDKPRAPTKFKSEWVLEDHGDILALNKPAGLRAQASRKGDKENLLDLARAKFGDVALFHRLDRDTSGVCLLTRPGEVNAYLDAVFKNRQVEKEYLAWVKEGHKLAEEGIIDARLGAHERRRDMMQVQEKGGKTAVTEYRILEQKGKYSLVQLRPVTGRTHQLRVHLGYAGAPIIGDRLYGGVPAQRLMLHARRISLPASGEFPARTFTAKAEWGKLPD